MNYLTQRGIRMRGISSGNVSFIFLPTFQQAFSIYDLWYLYLYHFERYSPTL